MKPVVVSVVGPTAVGKTKLGIEIAKRFNGEVISGDSMQIYRSMDIGTAKVTPKEMEGIPHHMIDIKEPEDSFSVAEFKERVTEAIEDISSRGKLPVIVGGTGLYIQSVLYDFNFSEQKRNREVTERLETELEIKGKQALYQQLIEIDPEQAEKIHPNNERRLIRALEIYESTGMTMSEYQKNQSVESPYHPILIGLEMDRELLYERINHRVDIMMEEGLLEEVQDLYDLDLEDVQSMRAIGYKEFIPYFKGEYDLEQAVELLKRNSRRYAKRQYTYFRNKMDVRWYSVTEHNYQEKFEIILRDLAGMIEQT
ncbi:tRNA dimethylallyltransferase [Thalassobacillus devorans]|uniref:tRNA dimethylallyltransferase n=1 Tax=Thalassobacillus devorans TaxID=279813 RepID=A0ABQ1P286_9BACI|nr:tRNA (adenosine(37)-N6)-dimethylallyltransferase MiaA [Thalassobacillus devorans]NIK27997.1 tRNA dimethylallyltransferase [Thalassobacillus devorans]GGC89743.1 tRNA dimethylallyltransferase [Thalassobacillus devorans]